VPLFDLRRVVTAADVARLYQTRVDVLSRIIGGSNGRLNLANIALSSTLLVPQTRQPARASRIDVIFSKSHALNAEETAI